MKRTRTAFRFTMGLLVLAFVVYALDRSGERATYDASVISADSGAQWVFTRFGAEQSEFRSVTVQTDSGKTCTMEIEAGGGLADVGRRVRVLGKIGRISGWLYCDGFRMDPH